MLRIRLTRRGRRNDPSFRLTVTERANPAKGKFLEELGFYNPKLKSKTLKKERILYWLSQGASCSPTVHNLLVTEGIIEGPKVKAWRPKKREGEDIKQETVAEEEKEEGQTGADAKMEQEEQTSQEQANKTEQVEQSGEQKE